MLHEVFQMKAHIFEDLLGFEVFYVLGGHVISRRVRLDTHIRICFRDASLKLLSACFFFKQHTSDTSDY